MVAAAKNLQANANFSHIINLSILSEFSVIIRQRLIIEYEVLELTTESRVERGIWIVASDAQLRIAAEQAIACQGYRRLLGLSVTEALTQTVDSNPDLCVICLTKSDCDVATKVIERFRQISHEIQFIIISKTANHLTELSTLDQGDIQVLSQPFVMLEFIATVERALSHYQNKQT